MTDNTPAVLRAGLSDTAGGVLWCHTSHYPPLDDLLTRVEKQHDPRILRVLPTPSRRMRPTTLASDVAAALGAHPVTTGRARSDVDMHQLIPLLLEQPVEHLLIGSAWWAHRDCLNDLTIVARAAGVTLWLLGTDPITAGDKAALHGLGLHVDVNDVLDAFADITGTPTGEPDTAVDPWTQVTSVPTSDFVTFLADARAQLPSSHADLVETTLRSEHTLAAHWFDTHPDVTTDQVAATLHQRWAECVSWTEFLTRVRGWQIAAFHTGRLLKVSPAQLAGTAAAVPSARQRSPQQWQQLRAWHEPCRAAACALVAAGLGSQDAIDVTLRHVSDDGSTITTSTGPVSIEPAAATYIRAAVHARHLDGAGPDDHLLVTASGRRPAARWVSSQATNARTTFGLPLASAGITGRTTTGDRWASRWGLTLIELT